MLHFLKISVVLICRLSNCAISSAKLSGVGLIGLPNRTPFAFAAAIPSCCRCRMLSISDWDTNDRICKTMSLINVPIRSLCRRVSKSGKSITTMSMPFSFVNVRHCFCISS